jgi:hypothetical protein
VRNSMAAVLGVLVGITLTIAFLRWTQPAPVLAQGGTVKFGYLQVLAGEQEMPGGGRGLGFVDMRNGAEWHCDKSGCVVTRQVPLDQTLNLPH